MTDRKASPHSVATACVFVLFVNGYIRHDTRYDHALPIPYPIFAALHCTAPHLGQQRLARAWGPVEQNARAALHPGGKHLI